VYTRNNGLHQQWDVIYADEFPDEPKKGELNEDFGLYVDRTFYIVTQMKSNRYIEMVDNKWMVIKTSNGRKGQEWWFDQGSLTVRSRQNNKSFNIENSGKNINMQVSATNS